MKKQWNAETQQWTFTFGDGLEPVVCGMGDYPQTIQGQFAPLGMGSKLGDAAAIPKSAENGFTVTEAMRRQAVLDMHEQLMAGDWNRRASAAPKQDPRIAARAAAKGMTYEAYVDWMLSELG